MAEYPGLVFEERENRLIASVLPAEEAPVLDFEALREFLTELGYGPWSLADDALVFLCEHYNSAVALSDYEIGERRDASFRLEISANAMEASIDVVCPRGGKSLDAEAIYLALGEAGITTGIDQEAIGKACAATRDERFVVAVGTPQIDGEHARFELLVSDARDRTPQVSNNGLIDFRELGAIPTVSAGQPLMRHIPPTTGTVGRNVRGEIIEPVPGKDEAFAEPLVGAGVSAGDPHVLVALVSGQPVRCGNGVNVEQVLRVRNVDMTSGNISFDGTVNIQGEVLPGMKVSATGDIYVGEAVDGAELDAGGDIHVAGGIIAKAHVRAGGAVSVRFVENAKVTAGTTIAIDDTALQGDLQANNQILVGLKSPQRGRLAGGSARAMLLIQTPILGSSSGGVTNLLLGVNPILEGKHQELLKRIEKQRANEQDLEKLVKHLTKQGDKAPLLERVKASWQQALQAWGEMMHERDELERELAMTASARVEIGIAIAGAVDLSFGKKQVRVRRNLDKGAFALDEDRVVFIDAAGNARHPG